MKFHMGVWDVAYADPDEAQATTTGQVAEILEEKYKVMEVFYDNHEEEIQGLIVDHLIDKLESISQGAPATPLKGMPFPTVETQFRNFLDRDEWQHSTGKVIMAAVLGISHRKKLKKSNGPRPAFIDTGLFQSSFSAWLE